MLTLENLKESYNTWAGDVNFTITRIDIVEILIIAFLFYQILKWIKDTRAWTLLKGILVILLFVFVAVIFRMNTILWIAEKTINVAAIAMVVIFQPELRKALEELGRKNFVSSLFSIEFGKDETEKFSEKTIGELVKACYEMGKVKTGALIVIENQVALTEYERTGIVVDGQLTSQLLINIFEKNTPLHDGAVIMRGNRVSAATCYLPLSDSMQLSKELGTRHRAALGISEVSDSFTIVVSEETGKVSIASGGQLYRNVDPDFLRDKLKFLQNHQVEPKRFQSLKRKFQNVKKDDEKADKNSDK
ncbi:MAG: diadenylate cyclase CdaA [Lachnospiraceae bacterium]|nr:diadenylate cyclase CdaA [Lachnospiraceae bacterium]